MTFNLFLEDLVRKELDKFMPQKIIRRHKRVYNVYSRGEGGVQRFG